MSFPSAQPSWVNRTGDLSKGSLRGSIQPNFTSALTRGTNGLPATPLTASLHHGLKSDGFHKWSTSRNDMHSWETRMRGNAAGQQGVAAPWAVYSLRAQTAPESLRPPTLGGHGPSTGGGSLTTAHYQKPQSALISSSTAEVNVASWTGRKGDRPLRGSINPNATKANGAPIKAQQPLTVRPGTAGDLLESSTAANDMESWNVRMGTAPGDHNATYATRGQWDPWAQTLTESNARAGTSPVRGSTYRTQVVPEGLNSSSTAEVDTVSLEIFGECRDTTCVFPHSHQASWENRINRAYPNELLFKSTRGKPLLDMYINHGPGFAGRKKC